MARPMKGGIDYFPLFCDAPNDPKFQALFAEVGQKTGWYVISRLWCEIYRVGCCYRWTEQDAKTFAYTIGEKLEVVSKVVNCAVDVNIFDKKTLIERGFLTSKRLQLEFFHIIRGRKKYQLPEGVLLLDEEQLRGVTVIFRSKRTVEESIAGNEHDMQVIGGFYVENLHEKSENKKPKKKEPPGYRKGCSKIGNHVYLTRDEYEKLCAEFTRDHVRAKITGLEGGIEDGRKLYTGYKNHYLTILKWLRNDVSMGKIRIDKGNTLGQRPNGGSHA